MTKSFDIESDFLLMEGIALSLDDLRYGYTRHWIGGATVVRIALDAVTRGDDDPTLNRIAMLLSDEYDLLPDIFSELDHPTHIHDPRSSARKWLYLHLKIAYKRRAELNDPLGVVEQIYADFDYPSSMARFVRYMPLSGNDEAGEEQLVRRWADYLEDEGRALREEGCGGAG